MTTATVPPIVLTASTEAALNADIAKVNGAKSGAYVIEITSSLTLDDALATIDLSRATVTLAISGAEASGGLATLNADGDFTSFTILSPASHVTIDSSVTVADSVSSAAFAPSAYNNLAVGAAVDLQDFAYNFDDNIAVISSGGSSSFEVDITPPGTTTATELFSGAQSGSDVVPVAMGLEDGRGDTVRLVDLSAAPLDYYEYVHLAAAAANSGAYILTLGALGYADILTTLNQDKSVVSVDLMGGAGTLTGGVGIAQNYVGLDGGSLTIDETLAYSGDMSVVSGSLRIVASEEGIFTGVLNVHGLLDGGGTLVTDGGSTTVVADDGLVSVAHWLATGAGTSVTFVGSQQDYSGAFSLGAGASVTVESATPGAVGSLQLAEVSNYLNAGGTLNVGYDDFLTIEGGVSTGETFNLGGGGTLDLLEAQNFRGQIDNFSSSEAVILSGDWNATGVTTVGQDTVLLLKNVAAGETARISFEGSFTLSQFGISDSVTGVTASTSITHA